MTYDEKLSRILEAIQATRETSINTSTVNLYITKADGLDDFDPNEIYDILHGIERKEKVLEIEDVPSLVAPHSGHPPASFLGNAQSHFSIKLLTGYDDWRSKVFLKEKKTYFFNKDKGILNIKGSEIEFKVGGRRIPYLNALVNTDDYLYHSDVANELEGAEQIKDAKNTYYELCRGITTRLSEFGISDFLEYDYNRARINPLYKRETK
jgi:hypothetical protein